MTLIVNMFGAPGSGKSTTAAGLFYLLKLAGKSVEYVPEVAKAFTYEERHKTLGFQAYIHGKQLRDLQRLMDKVDIIVTDSPTLLSYVYAARSNLRMPHIYPDSFYDFIADQFKMMPSVNFLIERVKPYSPVGRNQTEEESSQIGREIKGLLERLEIGFWTLKGDENAPKSALEVVRRSL